MIQRRQLLQAGLGSLALGAGWHALAAPATTQRLLVVFLRGAYDATNVVIPHSSSFYYEARPSIAIAKPGSGPGAALPLDSHWGLHPALGPSLQPLWQAGQLAFVPFSGLADTSRSHFEMQDKIELGQGSAGARQTDSGFLNRLALELGGRQAVSFTDKPPAIFRGAARIPNIALTRLGRNRVDGEQAARIARMYEGTELGDTVKEGFGTRDTVERELAIEMEAASRGAISPKGFQMVAPRIARLLSEQYRLAFVDVGRWDTHIAQGGAQGALADRLTDLGLGLAELQRSLGPAWAQTTVVVLSEFGRTFRENGNRGTDHGHGSALWVLGGAVRGGRLVGEQTQLSAATLHDNRDNPILNDYRNVLAGLFARQFQLGPEALARVFPGVRPVDLSLV